ncbi:MAG TPA: hypothetical protein V6D22_03080 [Candidatus Obscuribacterales bacterium]
MTRTAEERETLTLQLTAEEMAALRDIARRNSTTAAVMVRDWVRERLDEEQERKPSRK